MSLMAFDSPCEVAGVLEAPEGSTVPFILVRIQGGQTDRDKYLLKAGEGVSWEVGSDIFLLLTLLLYISEVLPHHG